jgi:PIN domain nuclease of toxin-antitoxin system
LKALLDTHTLIWWSENDDRIGGQARAALIDSDNSFFVSAVSIYEMRLKDNLGKLPSAKKLLANLERYFGDQSFVILPLDFRHADLAGRLPLTHRDPFDRMLIAQALTEDLTLVSNEELFDQFGVRRLW